MGGGEGSGREKRKEGGVGGGRGRTRRRARRGEERNASRSPWSEGSRLTVRNDEVEYSRPCHADVLRRGETSAVAHVFLYLASFCRAAGVGESSPPPVISSTIDLDVFWTTSVTRGGLGEEGPGAKVWLKVRTSSADSSPWARAAWTKGNPGEPSEVTTDGVEVEEGQEVDLVPMYSRRHKRE